MATQLNLDPETQDMLDGLIASGRFTSPEDAMREGLRLVRARDDFGEIVDFDKLDPEERAWLEQRIAECDADPHEGYSIEEVFGELKQRYENWNEGSPEANGQTGPAQDR